MVEILLQLLELGGNLGVFLSSLSYGRVKWLLFRCNFSIKQILALSANEVQCICILNIFVAYKVNLRSTSRKFGGHFPIRVGISFPQSHDKQVIGVSEGSAGQGVARECGGEEPNSPV